MLGGERALVDAIDEGFAQGLTPAAGGSRPDAKSSAKTSQLHSFPGFLINVGDDGPARLLILPRKRSARMKAAAAQRS
jgi:hypothetical protein